MDIKTPYRIIKYFLLRIKANKVLFSRKTDDKILFIDITELHESDGKTGIQRVTKNVLKYLYNQNEYLIKPVYALPHNAGFYYCDSNLPIRMNKNDIFFGLDLSMSLVPANSSILKRIYKKGIPVFFFLHDLIAIRYPDTVREHNKKRFPIWLKEVIQYSGIISNSKATQDDLKLWLSETPNIVRNKNLQLNYIDLGCDFSNKNTLTQSKNSSNIKFLMVSTVEPRKNYTQAIKAFDLLWKSNYDITLSIVGREGWNNDESIKLIKESSWLNKKLFWYNTGISDEELQKLYQDSDALISTSLSEGFGLSLVEAAYNNLPLIIRDIPIYREVAGNNAFYFSGLSPESLSEAIIDWIKLFKSDTHPKPFKNFVSWEECSKEIFKIITS